MPVSRPAESSSGGPRTTDHPRESARVERWGRPLAWMLAVVVLVWGALPYLPGQIDDAFIVFAYAHRVVEHGEIGWNTGERVEGYSSPLHLLTMILARIAGLDLSLFARILSFVSAVATLGLLCHPRFRTARGWLALAVAAWQPFHVWSVAGLETALATLIAVAGWPLIFGGRRNWAVGCGLLALFSLTRPEGAVWLAAGLFVRRGYVRAIGTPEAAVLGVLALLATYHIGRVAYFGALLPTPWLVKIVAIDKFSAGVTEAFSELLSATPLLVLTLLMRSRIPRWAWFPLALQTGLLVRAGGDWMGNGRLLLPGVIAAVAAGFVSGTDRTLPRWAPATILPFLMLTFVWEPAQMQSQGPKWRDTWLLRRPVTALTTPWRVPLLDDVTFLVGRVPVGAGVMMSDVGLPGNLDDIRIWDGAGLTDRVVANIIAGEGGGMNDALTQRYADPDDIWCVRYGLRDDRSDPADPWMKSMFPEVATQPDARGLFWRCRTAETVSNPVATERWRRLVARFPIQDEIRRHYARAQLTAGDVSGAVRTVHAATWVSWDAEGWLAFAPPAGAFYTPGRGWPMYTNGQIQSATLPDTFWQGKNVFFDVDDPGPGGATGFVRWEPPCGAPTEITVRSPAKNGLPPCSTSNPRALVAAFVNDEWRADFDRNLYVTLARTDATAAR